MMIKNKIPVLFFSKAPSLLEITSSFFNDEIHYDYRQIVKLEELLNLKKENFRGVIIIDLAVTVEDFLAIVKKSGAVLLSLSFIFIIDNEKLVSQIEKNNFVSYKMIFKPFRVNDLLFNVQNLFKNSKHFEESISFPNNVFFYPKTNEIRNSKGEAVRLTEKETEIINTLYKGQGTTMSKITLLKTIWGYDETISTHTLETHIYRLRKKLEKVLGEAELIKKEKLGYYLKI